MKWARCLLACVSLGWLGCADPCASGEVRVKKDGGGSVCVPTSGSDSEPEEADGEVGPDAGAYGSVKLPPTSPDASSSSPKPPPSSPSGCRTEDAGDLTVHLVSKAGAAPNLVASDPPDARYVLVQATWFAGNAGAPPFSALRAELVVQGAVYVLGTREVEGTMIDDVESTTLTITADTGTHVCAVGDGDVVSSLLPPVGATTPATVAWDPVAATLTMVLTTPAGADVELVFVRD